MKKILILLILLLSIPNLVKAGGQTPDYLTFTANENSTIGFIKIADGATIEYKKVGTDWTSATTSTSIPLNKDEYVQFKGDYSNATLRKLDYTQFSITGKVSASGDVNTLINYNGGSNIDLIDYVFYCLFKECTGLTDASELILPSTSLAVNCYREMFNGCTKLTKAPELPATSLAESCYYVMFQGCSSLITAPELPATTLAKSCYEMMFSGCTSLTTAPEILPATSLAESCYDDMFNGCTSLTTAPKLPATTLALTCYSSMFYGCTKLNKIVVNFTDWNSSQFSTTEWVENVATTGTFFCPEGLDQTNPGTSRIPNGWTVKHPEYLTFTANENSTIGFNKIADGAKIQYNDGAGWKDASELKTTPLTLNSGKSVQFKGDYSNVTINSTSSTWFDISGNVSVSGDINTLIDGVGGNIELKDNIYYHLFNGCKGLTDASNLKFPSKNLKPNSYASMFQGCTGLISAPKELPATTLAKDCYGYMFNGCIKLTTAPELPATTLAEGCYQGMFIDCTNLNKISVNFTDWNTSNSSTTNWVDGVAASGTFICPDELDVTQFGASFVPKDVSNKWTIAKPNYLTMTATKSTTIGLKYEGDFTIANVEYSLDNGNTWNELKANSSFTLDANKTALFRGDNPTGFSKQLKGYGAYGSYSSCTNTDYTYFTISGDVKLSGSIMSLIDKIGIETTIPNRFCFLHLFGECNISEISEDLLTATDVKECCYWDLFKNCSSLKSVPEKLFSKIKELKPAIFRGTFYACTSITELPENLLPFETLSKECYMDMFNSCSNITTAPKLPATTLVDMCYQSLFNGCSKLNKIEVNFTSWNNSSNATYDWVKDVATTGTFFCPNSLSIETGNNKIPNGWAVNPEYLTFTANPLTSIQGGSKIGFASFVEGAKIQYNLGDGWKDASTSTSITLNSGESVQFRGDYSNATLSDDPFNITQFTITGDVLASGDINTLIDGKGGDIELKDYAFRDLFHGCYGLTDASGLKLPSTKLAKLCYSNMFNYCTGLTTAPDLPATTLDESCYNKMFYSCTSLTTAPKLEATNLAKGCYGYMFNYCTGLTTAPKLEATTLAEGCYQGMFIGCTSLTTAPVLTRSTENYCFKEMFKGCTKLNTIEVNFISWDFNNDFTKDWVDGVAETGVFIINSSELKKEFGTSRIPNGWVVPEYLTFTSKQNGSTISTKVVANATIEYNKGDGWKVADSNTKITLENGYSVRFRGVTTKADFLKFDIEGNVAVSGDINTLIDGKGGDIELKSGIYSSLFEYCNGLTDASGLKLPSTKLSNYCYSNMFSYCTGLTKAPELPATTLADNCYAAMFIGCEKLTQAPELPATTLAEGCYQEMFKDCSSLKEITVKFTDWNTSKNSTLNWVDGVAASGTFACLKELEEKVGVSNIPEGWLVNRLYLYLKFTANASSEIGFEKIYTGVKFQYKKNNDDWKEADVSTSISLNKGDVVLFKGNNLNGLNTEDHNPKNDTQFKITGDVTASGDINSLMNDGRGGNIDLKRNNYIGLFQGCEGLTDVSELYLPSTSMTYNSYQRMFAGCTNIYSTPRIAVINGPSGASSMFEGCSSLFVVYVDKCLDAFLNNFSSNWLSGVAKTGIFISKEIDQVSDIQREVNYIPKYWYVNPQIVVLENDSKDGFSLSESKYFTNDFETLFEKLPEFKHDDIKLINYYSLDDTITVKSDKFEITDIVYKELNSTETPKSVDYDGEKFAVSELDYQNSLLKILYPKPYNVVYYSNDIELGAEIDNNDNTLIEFGTKAKKIDLQSSLIDYYEPEIYTDAACTKLLGDDELLEIYKLNDVVKLYKKPIEYTITLGENVTCSATKATIETPAISFSLANREDEQLKIKSVFINSTDVTSVIKDYAGSFKMSDYLTDVTIKAEYELKGFDIILKSDDIYNLSATSAFEGDEVTFSVKSKEYQVPVVMINGEEISSDNLDYKFIMGNKDVDITVTYSEIKIEELSLENSQETACAGNKLTANISVTDNAKYYSIIFADELINQGFENVDFIELTSSKVTLTIPTTAVSGEYEASFVAKSKNGVVSKPQALKFKVAYPTDVIKIKFGDVICIDNSSKQFVGYQWIKDGKEIPGATEQFYCETPKLTGVYSIKLTKVDGSIIETCSLKMSEGGASKSFSKNINVYPNPSKYGDPIYIDLADYNELEISKSRIEIYDLKGGLILKESNLSEKNQITLPKGFYNGALILDGRKYSFKFVVK